MSKRGLMEEKEGRCSDLLKRKKVATSICGKRRYEQVEIESDPKKIDLDEGERELEEENSEVEREAEERKTFAGEKGLWKMRRREEESEKEKEIWEVEKDLEEEDWEEKYLGGRRVGPWGTRKKPGRKEFWE
ncbi:hypothetical protein DM860_016715 [Cuscuta australis]|uniref:Uncharacterized protein n=1 Tax=Cuscuta australis TaxID=267555 RepID=A0A328DKL4_9ASTE|nr:hypothetical protein DM860_016715 [Cuscuta australis]